MNDDKWIVQLRKGVFELAILSLLKSQNMYGYEISKFLKDLPTLKISEGAIYPILKRLAEKKWIDCYWEDPKEGPRRKYYLLTKEGEEVLKNRITMYKEVYSILIILIEGRNKND